MQNTKLLDIEASLQTLVRRAYELGRNDALEKVVEVLHADRSFSDQLALMGPNRGGPEPEHAEMNGSQSDSATKPWWAWPVR